MAKMSEITIPVPGVRGEHITKLVDTPKGQKFKAGTEVFIRPIYEPSMSHFRSDVITTAEYTHSQAYGGGDVNSYSTPIASWYEENQLMPTNGMNINECRNACFDYFGIKYSDMKDLKNKRCRDPFVDDILDDISSALSIAIGQSKRVDNE